VNGVDAKKTRQSPLVRWGVKKGLNWPCKQRRGKITLVKGEKTGFTRSIQGQEGEGEYGGAFGRYAGGGGMEMMREAQNGNPKLGNKSAKRPATNGKRVKQPSQEIHQWKLWGEKVTKQLFLEVFCTGGLEGQKKRMGMAGGGGG